MTKAERTAYITEADKAIQALQHRADGIGYPIDRDQDYIELCRLITFVEPFGTDRAGYLTKAKREKIEWLVNYLHMMLDYEEMKRGEA